MPSKKSLDELIRSGMVKKGNDSSLKLKRLPIGIPAFDALLGGGVPIGRCLEIYGPESTGKTLISQYVVAAIQKSPKPVALYLDLEQCYDEEWWNQTGIDTEKLMVSRPATAEQAVDIMTTMVESLDELGIIILDSVPGMIPAPIADTDKSAEDKTIGLVAKIITLMYHKLMHLLSERNVTLLVTNQMRENIGAYDELAALPGGRAQRHYNQIILRTRREGWIKENDKPVGFYMEIISKKNKTCSVPDGTSITLPFRADGGIDLLTAFIEDGIAKDLITRRGPYYYWGEDHFLGIPNLRTFLRENPDRREELERQVAIS